MTTGSKKPTTSKTDPDEDLALTGWSQAVDLTDALKGKELPGPTVCSWVDGDLTRALFYPNEVHSVFGEPESMKSWLLLHACHQQIAQQRHVFYIDMEATDRSIVARMRSAGATATQLSKRFHYFRPDEPITTDDQKAIARLVRRMKPSLVVMDGVTEAFSLLGLSINAPEDTAQWFREVSRRFQVRPTASYPGPSIVELDHVVKSREGRGGWAIGSQHKKAGIKGAAYAVERVKPFGLGRHGVSRILLEKDSAGQVAWVAAGGRRLVAELHAESDETTGGVVAYLQTPDVKPSGGADEPEVPRAQQQDFRVLMEAVWSYVRDNPSVSKRTVRDNVVGRNDHIADAINQLIHEGHLRNEGSDQRSRYVVGKRFKALRVIPSAREAD